MIARFRDVTYTYPSSAAPALAGASLSIDEGVFTLVAGPSAGGKSTLLRLFNGLVPQFHGGTLAGDIDVAGFAPTRTPAREMARIAGMVFQEPEAQGITDVVEDEIAFGMEQQGVPRVEMEARIDRLLGLLDLRDLRYRTLATLSGGERQRVAIAAVLALEPRLLLLDEPTSQLDPGNAIGVLDAIDHLGRSLGTTVVIAEHRLEQLLARADLFVHVDAGIVSQILPGAPGLGAIRGLPPVCVLGAKLGLDPLPLTVVDASSRIDPSRFIVRREPHSWTAGDALVDVNGLDVFYGEFPALQGITATIHEGEVVALMGANGSGKSTLFRALAGLVKPARGEISFRGETAPGSVQARTAFAAYVPQDPALALYHESVGDEVRATLRHRRLPHREPDSLAGLERWNVEHVAARDPRDLSAGQQQRVAIAALLAHQPPVWLLDEPTRGADASAKAWLTSRLHQHASSGGAAIVATHDIEAAATFATRVIGLDAGLVAFDLPVEQAFGNDGPMPTQTARLIPGALTPADLVAQ